MKFNKKSIVKDSIDFIINNIENLDGRDIWINDKDYVTIAEYLVLSQKEKCELTIKEGVISDCSYTIELDEFQRRGILKVVKPRLISHYVEIPENVEPNEYLKNIYNERISGLEDIGVINVILYKSTHLLSKTDKLISELANTHHVNCSLSDAIDILKTIIAKEISYERSDVFYNSITKLISDGECKGKMTDDVLVYTAYCKNLSLKTINFALEDENNDIVSLVCFDDIDNKMQFPNGIISNYIYNTKLMPVECFRILRLFDFDITSEVSDEWNIYNFLNFISNDTELDEIIVEKIISDVNVLLHLGVISNRLDKKVSVKYDPDDIKNTFHVLINGEYYKWVIGTRIEIKTPSIIKEWKETDTMLRRIMNKSLNNTTITLVLIFKLHSKLRQ